MRHIPLILFNFGVASFVAKCLAVFWFGYRLFIQASAQMPTRGIYSDVTLTLPYLTMKHIPCWCCQRAHSAPDPFSDPSSSLCGTILSARREGLSCLIHHFFS